MKFETINSCFATLFACAAGLFLSQFSLFAEAGAGGGGGGSAGAEGGVPGVASRYVTRMQERVKKADDAALRGSQLLADGDYEGAITEFRSALDFLPDAPMTKDRRDAYTKQYANASVKLARQRAEEAQYDEAITLVQNVMAPDVDPDNYEAKVLLEQLNDPEYYSPAVTPDHLERVRQVERGLKVGQGFIEIGDFDGAEREYWAVLNKDPYNQAARRSLEEVERERSDYFEVARNHTRAEFLRRVAEGWESPVPYRSGAEGVTADSIVDGDTKGIQEIERKLKTIIIPSVEFVNTPLSDTLDFLRERAAELDQDPDPLNRGIDIILNTGGGIGGAPAAGAPAGAGAAGGLGFDEGGAAGGFAGGGGVEDTQITLKLSNVPLVEALKYTLSLAQLKYKVEPNAVVVLPLSASDTDLYTNVYVVPPTFLSSGGGGGGGGGGGAPADPFSEPAGGGGGGAAAAVRRSAKEVLEGYGVVFGPGATATFNPNSSQLIVKQTQDQMELVEAVIDTLRTSADKQIFVEAKFVEIGQENGKELGFDWLLGAFNLNSSNSVFGSGGTAGSTRPAVNVQDYSFVQPGQTFPVGGNAQTAQANLLTGGLRSGSQGLSFDSIDALISEASATAAPNSELGPALFGIGGVFTDPQFQVMIRALNQQKGVDLLSAPSVLTQSGTEATIEIVREFIYPTEYDPPEIPNQVGGGGGGAGGISINLVPVTPANPTGWEVRNVGVMLRATPSVGSDNFTISLVLEPEVIEFEGFVNYGSPIFNINPIAIPPAPTQVLLTDNEIKMPVFARRSVQTNVVIWDNQTVALGGLIREDVQDVQDKVPFLGDLPAIGRLFRSNIELHLKKNLTIFVTAKIVDPSGQPIHVGGEGAL